MSSDVGRMPAELGRMPNRKSGKGVVTCLRSSKDLPDRSDISAAKQPIYAELATDLRGAQTGLRRLGHNLHVGRGPAGFDPVSKFDQRRKVDADVLEADVLEPERSNLVEDVQTVFDRLVSAGEHEDKVHRA